MAFYLLLRTEAKYKCYHSITNDTCSILKAVKNITIRTINH